MVVVVCLLVAGVVVVPIARLVAQVDRIQGAFDGLSGRPPESGRTRGSLDVLVVGVDGSGASEPTSWPGGSRAPLSLMVMHFDADRRGATVVGLPLEVEVKVPGHGTRTLGSVPELGDPPLLVATVESLTGFRMDHVAVLDWQAFKTIVDRLGGIDVMVGGGGGALSGAYRMQVDGTEALKVVSPRHGVDSVAQLRLQLTLMDAVVDGSLHQHKSPLLVYNFLDAVTENLAVDEGWSVASMARLFFSVWALRSADIEYVTLPASCAPGRDLCRPRLDERAAPDFWSAVERDRIQAWLSENDSRGRVNAHR